MACATTTYYNLVNVRCYLGLLITIHTRAGPVLSGRILELVDKTSFIRDIGHSYLLQLKYSNGTNYYHEIIAKIYYFNLGTLAEIRNISVVLPPYRIYSIHVYLHELLTM